MLDGSQTEIVSREALAPPPSPERPAQTVDWASILGYSIDDQDASSTRDASSVDSGSPGETQSAKPAEVAFRLFAPTRDAPAGLVQNYILPPSPPPEIEPALAAVGLAGDLPQVAYFTDQDVETAHATHRPRSYYLTPPLEDDDERALRIRACAVSGDDVQKASGERWAGCELPWRVTQLGFVDRTGDGVRPSASGAAGKTAAVVLQGMPVGEWLGARKRHRPNKKRRIILRKRRAAEEAKATKTAVKKKNKKKTAEAAKAVQAVQAHKRTEEEDREKRTRLNRLKKALLSKALLSMPQLCEFNSRCYCSNIIAICDRIDKLQLPTNSCRPSPRFESPSALLLQTRSRTKRTRNGIGCRKPAQLFRPSKARQGITSFHLRQYAQATLGSGSLRKVVMLPEGEDENEWLAFNLVDFYNQINLLFGAVSEFCTDESCPEMKATDEFEYLWQDSDKYKKPTKMPAHQYVEHLMAWVQKSIDDDKVFPSRNGVEFNPDFRALITQFFKRLARVYAHIYCHHFPVVGALALDKHMNTSFKHFVLFVKEFKLDVGRDYWGPLQELVDSMLASIDQ
ncbi:hypothetical protein Dda_4546 [Drechslerella dactyloides]|uniref:Maintenance of ploidy protein mob1 n=1 Tax=Drechslerella dactyloides TaxID=74499 RepID=A0AAD6NI16_DREDA|nr:hypothetical protein Dda_4546 [Drechslerella dactyloides]